MYSTPGAALIRSAAYPPGLNLPPWPDLAAGQPEAWRAWLSEVWALPEFALAVTSAAPQLAEQITRAVAGEPMRQHRLQRLVESAVRYVLRWTTRPTPFGRFAGIAPVTFGTHAAVRWGEAHHQLTRPDGRFIAEHTARAESDTATLRGVAVVTNSLGYRRGGTWVLPCARVDGDRRFDVEINLTERIQMALQEARSPVMFRDLAARLAGPAPADVVDSEHLLAALVRAGVLLSALRPPMTVADPVDHLARHLTLPEPGGQTALDLRLDTSVTLPPAVITEAARAASALVAVAPRLPGWTEYHGAFIERWGPGAAVPLRDVLMVLGFPAGYRGSPRRDTAAFTGRDRLLAQLAQHAALDGCAEVPLEDDLITRLRGDDQRVPLPHTELRFTLAAETLHDLDRGAFTLTVVSGSRHAGVAAGRFLALLTPTELASFRRVYENLPTALPGAHTVQLSGPPLDAHLATVAQTPELLPVLPVGEFRADASWTVEDLAVTGDDRQLWLVTRTSGRPVEPLLFNSVLLATRQQPLMRFLTEIWSAWRAPCRTFDWGQAGSLPFLPRVRRGRSILHSARWTIDQAALPPRSAAWPTWRDAWQRSRERLRIPREILVGTEDVRLRLDLDDNTHLAVLRSHLDRQRRTAITEAPGPAGWFGGRPAEVLLTLTHTPAAARAPRAARAASTLNHRPGTSPWLETRMYGRADEILAGIAGRADTPLPAGWWFLRYPDPEPHLRLRIPVAGPAQFSGLAASLAHWADVLEHDGILHDYSLHAYRPETRYGTGRTLAAAESVFAADSRAVLDRLAGDRQAATAAGMIAIAQGVTGNGLRWLAEHVPHHGGPRLNPAQLHLARASFEDHRLTTVLATYRALAHADGLDLDQVLADLLHLHHARMIGVDMASERHCLRLARTIARAVRARAAS